jgi:hypothetical protein
MNSTHYDLSFFRTIHSVSTRSAEVVVPLLLEALQPRSVVDVGCGTGAWLNEFRRCGVDDIRGIEGEWAPTDFLEFAPGHIDRADLGSGFDLGRRFDLAVTVEVAEHIELSKARQFVSDLTKHADFVYFTAAIPGQGGTSHLNEQWPDFWASVFGEHGFRLVDWPRQALWNDARVDPCVIQNGFLYLREGVPEPDGLPRREPWPLRMVHPRLFEHTLAKMSDPETLKACLTAKKALMMLPALIRRSVMERLPS